MSINAAKQKMSFLASILESYESLLAGRIGNPEMTKEDYDQIDPEEIELIDIRWCLASGIRRAQCFMEITGRQCLDGSNTKLGFDKSKVACFQCKQKGHFKRECVNREVADHINPFHDDYYKKAIYHKNNEQLARSTLKQISEGSSREQTQDLVTTLDDEGFNWNKYLLKEKLAFVAEKKILQEKTLSERQFADIRLDEMQKAYDEAGRIGRWDKKRECYTDYKGNPIVDSSKVVYEDLLAVIPLSGEYYLKKDADKDYLSKLDKEIREVMTASLRKRDEERLQKNVEKMVDESKKTVEVGSGEGEQKDDESLKKIEEKVGEISQEKTCEKLKKPAGDAVAKKQQMIEEDQKHVAKEAEVPKTEVVTQTESSKLLNIIDNKTDEQCKKCMETCNACTENDKKKNIYKTKDMERSKIERVFNDKCK
ncbi:putative transcription factor interactor and regulator CCHC(Zn) family [Helianthus annuus]|uniref:Transcription factor interactor and regulator CCHC(Zn) family n=1 Tax=Helianthus annuus TaxID=4232 RepID=A0A9K3N020_HELAN|nr:putative transcription factor interactor and regulator CCHC(Zn) family [Helianthus annuus]KAJ0501634.1 putative transcription factor interactor and regulator CCHC(Zn) family [Helianthus annuus]KAJ0509483.1 putative transcription factor interactor and regulator CCHC(Zn) family [Helianthus annuus]KAJ0517540.1 putative transcription factor interactor and regulator CCHC(Zn) family [Helianthus annuus]KAJ0685550.1 putative transcription factor interactor and regulator CCHC(Zn) family [Helianthus a